MTQADIACHRLVLCVIGMPFAGSDGLSIAAIVLSVIAIVVAVFH